jgi:hypothetical protein
MERISIKLPINNSPKKKLTTYHSRMIIDNSLNVFEASKTIDSIFFRWMKNSGFGNFVGATFLTHQIHLEKKIIDAASPVISNPPDFHQPHAWLACHQMSGRVQDIDRNSIIVYKEKQITCQLTSMKSVSMFARIERTFIKIYQIAI